MAEHLFIEPLDVLYLRGNKLFGDLGAYGEALMPPWPSVAAGAIRSRMLADHGVDIKAFATSKAQLEEKLQRTVGTLTEPGSFRVSLFTLARRINGHIEPIFPLPADLVVTEEGRANFMRPRRLPESMKCSMLTSHLPVLAQNKQSKAKSSLWLTVQGMNAYLGGHLPVPEHLVASAELWTFDPRLGITLDSVKRSAAQGGSVCQDGVNS